MTIGLWTLIMVLVAGGAVLTGVPIMVTIERRGSAWMQRRSGPNRVGPLGLMQPLSDAVKLAFKEENIPAKAHPVLFKLAPALAVIPPLVALSVVPLAGHVNLGGQEFAVQVSNLNVGLLFLLAISSLHVFSVLTAGWASNNKFSLMGALRASSQMISYEIAIGICIASLVITYGTLDLREIVRLQESGSGLPFWGVLLQPLCFLILWVCSFAETNRLPFDLPEGESELVAGYHAALVVSVAGDPAAGPSGRAEAAHRTRFAGYQGWLRLALRSRGSGLCQRSTRAAHPRVLSREPAPERWPRCAAIRISMDQITPRSTCSCSQARRPVPRCRHRESPSASWS